MRGRVRFIASMALSSVLFLSCSKHDTPVTPGTAPPGGMIATVNNTFWKSDQTSAVILNGTITVSGWDTNNEAIVLAISTGTSPGSYDVKGSATASPAATISMTPNGETTYASSNFTDSTKVGTLTILEIDSDNQTISGTFSGTAKRLMPIEQEIEIKSGSFNKIPYRTQPLPNSFSAKIDGTSLDAPLIWGTHSQNKLTLTFSTADSSRKITLTVPDNVTSTSHDFGYFNIAYFGRYLISHSYGEDIYESVDGDIIITFYNSSAKRIEGTFNFSAQPYPLGGTAANTIIVSDGAFAVSYD